MSYDKRPPNWGCLTAIMLMTPIAMVVLGATMMGGGGCEGRKPTCVGDYTPLWIMMGVLVAVSIGLALTVNILVAGVRSWLRKRIGS
ncbi:hypothetical protein SAMN05192583_1297 [Sphingomonas gellani]|uniref:Uncharacterized protein n=1 Tax=Sphingomonas gellani TaxID=1166340 RepID=A0A1H8BBJ5_9SPHN|nr:hypothetical protein SAMN05192583_1297 [Sphingomonas gellani]